VVRIFNTYGPRMHPNDGRVVSNFIMQALTGRDITVFGAGSQTRSFCYVDDMVEGIYRMMNNSEGFTGPVNLCNPGEFTILELAERVIHLTGSRSKIVFKPLPADDPTQRRPAIELARQKLGWQPTMELEQGLERTITYFKILFLEKILHQLFHNVEQVAAAILGDAVGVVDDPYRLPQNFGFRRQRPLLLLILPAQKPGRQLLFLGSQKAHDRIGVQRVYWLFRKPKSIFATRPAPGSTADGGSRT